MQEARRDPKAYKEGWRIVMENLDAFLDWGDQVTDPDWLREIRHICKEMEERAEEIRDAGRDPQLGLPYIEHCLPGLVTFCEWFKHLPWDEPGKAAGRNRLLLAIKRDLEIGRREVRHPKSRDSSRFAVRSSRQAMWNASALQEALSRQSTTSEAKTKMHVDLVERLQALHGMLVKAEGRSHRLRRPEEPTDTGRTAKSFGRALDEALDEKRTVKEAGLEHIAESLGLCDELLGETTPAK